MKQTHPKKTVVFKPPVLHGFHPATGSKRIEEIFGWAKTTGCFRKSRYRGVERTHAAGQYVVATWNLVRMAKLMMTAPPRFARA